MKKILLGCGVVVLLVLGVGGYFGYLIWPEAKGLLTTLDRVLAELEELDARHPYDPDAASLDPQRFLAMLAVREAVAAQLERVGHDIDAFARSSADDEGPGMLAVIQETLRALTTLADAFPPELARARMGQTEFAAHTRTLWSVLRRIDTSTLAIPPLRGLYADMKARYRLEVDRNFPDAPPLDELIGDVPHPVLETATALVEADAERVQRALRLTTFDPLFMSLPIGPDDEGRIVFFVDEPAADTEDAGRDEGGGHAGEDATGREGEEADGREGERR